MEGIILPAPVIELATNIDNYNGMSGEAFTDEGCIKITLINNVVI